MLTRIISLKDESDEAPKFEAGYSCEPKQALINFTYNPVRGNFNTASYPTEIDGIYESPSRADAYYFEDKENRITYGAFLI